MSNPNPVCRFTPESARIASALAVQAKQQRKAEPLPIADSPQNNAIAEEFTDAIQDTLSLLQDTPDWKAKAALARAIRDLRETWHLITSTPRPGLAKGKPNANRRPLNSASPDAPA